MAIKISPFPCEPAHDEQCCATKAQASLHKCADLPEPSLLQTQTMAVDDDSDQILALLDMSFQVGFHVLAHMLKCVSAISEVRLDQK